MAQDQYTENLLIKVAWYYYKENLTQNEIASLLEISRTKVVRLLERARLEEIVQFQIKGVETNCLSVEKEFKDAFSLLDVFIIPTPPPSQDVSDSLARAASQYLNHKLQPDDLLGLGWGKAVSRTVDYLSMEPTSSVSVVTLTGGVNYYLHNRPSQDRGMEKFRHIHVIPAPFLASTEEMATIFLTEPSIKEILALGCLSKYILVGIGGVCPEATIIQEEKMTLNELTFIKQQEAVGDILGQFFDRNGNVIPLPHHKRLIGMPLATLTSRKNVIAVAGGEKKTEAIYGALKGGYIHSLITDEETALSLLRMEVQA
ncbi:sugar-binding transcriptional regulator [Sutcliffiella halmapala]|uniref:sugar-binding transcriptional regulator n=1 Tax=Sutcliffiella halmapala TaxID=79882 RepID=UPI0009954595|nr:sugar-binding transcriptional regulator [Sutcliffiella halmapala]